MDILATTYGCVVSSKIPPSLAARGGTPDNSGAAIQRIVEAWSGGPTPPPAKGALGRRYAAGKGALDPEHDKNELSAPVLKLARRARTQHLPENQAQIEGADVNQLAL